MRRKDRNFRTVKESEDGTEKLIDRLVEEINTEDMTIQDLEQQIRRHKIRFWQRVGAGVAVTLALAIGIYLLIALQTYSKARVLKTYSDGEIANSSYAYFNGGILKYSRDGAAYLNQQGEEKWNQSYQISNPVVEQNKKAAVIADKGGNDIWVVEKDGVKGEIHTTMPIEKVAVSQQGIVGAILRDDMAAKILCYDMEGNVLVEMKTSPANTGYPMDLSISENGETVQVLYLTTQEGKIASEIVYYNFGKNGNEKKEYVVSREHYENVVMAEGAFLDRTNSVGIHDKGFVIYRGESQPKEVEKVSIKKKIKSAFFNDRYIGLILQNEKKGGCELRLYNTAGKKVLSKNFKGEYSQVQIHDSQVILYEGKKCCIFSKSGVKKFEGELSSSIQEMFPISGVNKYIVINTDGIQEVRLVK
ncbi:hypothetical protein FYJ34_08165 [Clostridiaceae bacterium 68-1-5]|uniref:Uncharacterized protein n=1 Tax=Suipraeoptans intestinalis TaxID=2606628 RepID=A0A6N7V0W1_9FIRM|nr:DUF5711 family protein [Suipraeoptans intestinalis]MSR94235.1 hypothetical protein [Suipraeoptans intestinalis]